jgi:hypothetical protein
VTTAAFTTARSAADAVVLSAGSAAGLPYEPFYIFAHYCELGLRVVPIKKSHAIRQA